MPGNSDRRRPSLLVGDVAALAFPDRSFDLVVSTLSMHHWADPTAGLAEIGRVLRPGGRALVLDTDWDSIVWRSSDDQRMERVLVAWEEHLVEPHLPRTLKGSLERVGFQVAPPQVVPLLNVGFDQATYSAGLLEITARFVVGRKGLTAEEVNAWAADLRVLGAEAFFSLNRYLFLATKQS